MNRLAGQTSPYLRQHRDNPVDWYPWGDEAFAEARRRDVPILLSVGYSSCHWCHVMAHESFENDAIAALMNERFVNVKVDREERPDVDAIYMQAVQAMTGRGGWPMTVLLDHDARPFFGGTYFPPAPRHGMPSFPQLIDAITEAWTDQRDEVADQAARLTEAIAALDSISGGDDVPDLDAVDAAAAALAEDFDADGGGFGGAPKFPASMSLELLLRFHRRTGDPAAADMVATSLDAMASGGMYDHLGGGFSRYSVDERWMVPHFEKMLYDNALLARTYLHSWQLTGNPHHRQVLDETIGYVLRDLRHPDGGFFSAEDADSEGIEGKFYVFTPAEVRAVVGDDAEAAIEWYGITEAGNFEGNSIPWRPERGSFLRPPHIEEARAALFDARATRVRPGLDDKVLTEWNGLFLASLAEAAAATGTGEWLTAAEANAEFLVTSLRRADGRWLRSWQAGDGDRPASAQHLAYAHDYAALIDAFTRLGEATGQRRWIDEAVATADDMVALFWDDAAGGLFTTGHDAEVLVTRPKDLQDNATPSANSIAAMALLRLAALVGRDDLAARADAILALIGPLAQRHPRGFAHLLCAVDQRRRGAVEVVVPGDQPELMAATAGYHPRLVIAWGEAYDSPLWEGRSAGLAYVCEHFTCQAPTDDPATLTAQLADA